MSQKDWNTCQFLRSKLHYSTSDDIFMYFYSVLTKMEQYDNTSMLSYHVQHITQSLGSTGSSLTGRYFKEIDHSVLNVITYLLYDCLGLTM